MNGVVDITVNGKKHTLRFGMMGVLEFERQNFINPTTNNAKIIVDLLYGGLYGEAMAKGKSPVAYHTIVQLHDEMAEQEDYPAQIESVWKAFGESKYGSEYLKKMQELADAAKKKADESLSQ